MATLGTLFEGAQVNLILRTHENFNDPVWSVILCIIILLLGTGYYILYIMRTAFYELEHGSNDTTKQKKLLQLSSNGD